MGLWREDYFRFRRITDCLWPDPYRAAHYDQGLAQGQRIGRASIAEQERCLARVFDLTRSFHANRIPLRSRPVHEESRIAMRCGFLAHSPKIYSARPGL